MGSPTAYLSSSFEMWGNPYRPGTSSSGSGITPAFCPQACSSPAPPQCQVSEILDSKPHLSTTSCVTLGKSPNF